MSKSTQEQDNLNFRLQAPEAERNPRIHLHLLSKTPHSGWKINPGGGMEERGMNTQLKPYTPKKKLIYCHRLSYSVVTISFFLHSFAILNFIHSLSK